VADKDGGLPFRNGLYDYFGIPFSAGVRVLTRKIDRAGRVAVALELLAQEIPAPGTVIRTVDQGEMHMPRLMGR
jgi:hypothetical protein